MQLTSKSYSKGVKLNIKEMKQLEKEIKRLPKLDKWFLTFSAISYEAGALFLRVHVKR